MGIQFWNDRLAKELLTDSKNLPRYALKIDLGWGKTQDVLWKC